MGEVWAESKLFGYKDFLSQHFDDLHGHCGLPSRRRDASPILGARDQNTRPRFVVIPMKT